MECEFESSTGVGEIINKVIGCIYLFSLIAFLFRLMNGKIDSFTFFLGVLLFILLVRAAVLSRVRRKIYADDKKLTVLHTLFKRNIYRKVIPFSEVESASYRVESRGDRLGNVHYYLILQVLIKNGGGTEFTVSLDIEQDFPAQHPDEYKAYVAEQPLSQLCEVINERAGLL